MALRAIPDLVQIIKATTVSSIAFVILQMWLFGLIGFPRSVFLIDFAGNILLLSGIRLAVRILRERSIAGSYPEAAGGRLLVIGAGDAGASLCSQALDLPPEAVPAIMNSKQADGLSARSVQYHHAGSAGRSDRRCVGASLAVT